MRAIVYDEYGSADVLRLEQMPEPQATVGKVVIRTAACSVNPIDWRLRRGEARWLLPGGFPRIPGYDIAGTIAEVADGSRFEVGDRVMAYLSNRRGGGYAELVGCSEQVVARLPSSLPFEDAAGLGLAGTTALQCLRDHGQLSEAERVVITGASGGVGSLAVQIAFSRGAHVIAIASGEASALAKTLGAHEFFDYKQPHFLSKIEPCHLFLDAAGKIPFREAKQCILAGGRFISTEPSLKNLWLSVLTGLLPARRTARAMLARPNAGDLQELIELYEQGSLRCVLDQVVPLADAPLAHRRGESGEGFGKIILNTRL